MAVQPLAFARLLASSDVNVDFDITFAAQFVLFATFLYVLKPILFDPLLRLFEEREARTDLARAQARALDAKAGELMAKYESELERVRQEAATEREALRAETAKLEAKILADARNDAASILEQGKAKLEAEVKALRAELKAGQPALSAQIASRILGREVQS